MPLSRIPLPCAALLFAGLIPLSGCGGIKLGADALSRNLPPEQAQVCRDAARQVAAEHGLFEQNIKNVDYQEIRTSTRTGSNPLRGFEAWIYPLDGPGRLVVQLSPACNVQQVRPIGLVDS